MTPVITTVLAAVEAANTIQVDGRAVVEKHVVLDTVRLYLAKDRLTAFVDIPEQNIVIRDGYTVVTDRLGRERVIGFEVTTTRALADGDLRAFNLFAAVHSNA